LLSAEERRRSINQLWGGNKKARLFRQVIIRSCKKQEQLKVLIQRRISTDSFVGLEKLLIGLQGCKKDRHLFQVRYLFLYNLSLAPSVLNSESNYI